MGNRLTKFVHFKNTLLLLCMVAISILSAVYFDKIKLFTEIIIKHYALSVIITSAGCIGIGTAHALTKKTKQDNTFFLKFLGNPFIAAVFTAVTYGILINACFALLYIILYDKDVTAKYPIDKVSTSIAVSLLLVASIYQLGKMVWEVCRPLQTDATTEKMEEEKNS